MRTRIKLTSKARVRATGEIIEVEKISDGVYGRADGTAAIYRKRALDFSVGKQKAK